MSRAYQRLTILWDRKDKNKKDLAIVVRRTGYYNFWINDKHYFYDSREEKNSLAEVDMHNYFPGTQKKGTIIISKK